MKTKTARKPKVKTEYLASIDIQLLGRTYTAKGKTAREAIENLKAKNTKGHSILTVSKGDIKRDKIISAPLTFKLFSESKLMREIALKNIVMLFDF